jgi:hypothetical protein
MHKLGFSDLSSRWPLKSMEMMEHHFSPQLEDGTTTGSNVHGQREFLEVCKYGKLYLSANLNQSISNTQLLH